MENKQETPTMGICKCLTTIKNFLKGNCGLLYNTLASDDFKGNNFYPTNHNCMPLRKHIQYHASQLLHLLFFDSSINAANK